MRVTSGNSMKFKTLQENLRKRLARQMEEGELTGLQLAERTGFKQAHISNFLNRKRGLSVEGMDRVLAVQQLSILDLLDQAEIDKRASILPPSETDFENVALVDSRVAATEPIIMTRMVKEILKFRRSFLRALRSAPAGDRQCWERFVEIVVEGHEGMSMFPRLLPGATVLIDRHYNSLKRYRKGESNMYAVRKSDGNCTIRYVEVAGNSLLLRPHNHAYPVEVMTIAPGWSISDYIVGRVCHVGIET